MQRVYHGFRPPGENDHALPRRRSPSCCRCATARSRCCSGSARSTRSAAAGRCPGGYLAAGETLEAVDPPPPRDEGRRARALPPRAARDAERPRPPPERWQLATAYLGLVPTDVDPAVPDDTRWHPVDALPPMAFDHGAIVLAGRERLRAKLSYTNLGFALAPDDVHDLRAARPLRAPRSGTTSRRRTSSACCSAAALLEPTGSRARARPDRRPPGDALPLPRRGALEITDQFAVLRPPGIG